MELWFDWPEDRDDTVVSLDKTKLNIMEVLKCYSLSQWKCLAARDTTFTSIWSSVDANFTTHYTHIITHSSCPAFIFVFAKLLSYANSAVIAFLKKWNPAKIVDIHSSCTDQFMSNISRQLDSLSSEMPRSIRIKSTTALLCLLCKCLTTHNTHSGCY